jgi:hypothetical protein
MDIGRVKGLMSGPETHHQKKRLCEIVRMLVGLRKSWQNWKLHEDVPSYRPSRRVSSPEAFFHHETLEMYDAALELMAWLVSLSAEHELPGRLFRQIDESVTSVILNIAEGNGR